jgi:hypothetical protein
MADTEYTREQIEAAGFDWTDSLDRPDEHCDCHKCAAFYAALPSASLGEQRERDNDLDPRAALAYAKRMKEYCEAFNDRDWVSVSLFGSVDEKNLAGALDNLTECAAMLMNMAGRVAASPASKSAGGGGERERETPTLCIDCGCIPAFGEAHGPRCPARGTSPDQQKGGA